MGMTVETIAHANLLHVVVSGDFSLDEAKRTFAEIIEAIRENNSSKVLFDGRAIVGKPTFVDRFYYGDFIAASIRKLREDRPLEDPQFAYLLREPTLHPQRLGETLAINRGINIRVFEEAGQALSWLGLTS